MPNLDLRPGIGPVPADDIHLRWLAGRSDDEEVRPGLTIGAFKRLFLRPPTPEGLEFFTDVEYGRGGELPLHLHTYLHTDRRPRPAVLFVHGGAWYGGHPFGCVRRAAEVAAMGFVTATIGYRLVPAGRWPGAINDVKAAVRWVRANADELGVDPERIVIVGTSAGGHLSALVALTPGRLEGDGGNPGVSSHVAAAMLVSPMTDMTAPGCNEAAVTSCRDFLGTDDPEVVRAASPVCHVAPGGPPILTVTGDADQVTAVGMIRKFHAKLERAGVVHELQVVPGAEHAFELLPAGRELTHTALLRHLQRTLAP